MVVLNNCCRWVWTSVRMRNSWDHSWWKTQFSAFCLQELYQILTVMIKERSFLASESGREGIIIMKFAQHICNGKVLFSNRRAFTSALSQVQTGCLSPSSPLYLSCLPPWRSLPYEVTIQGHRPTKRLGY